MWLHTGDEALRPTQRVFLLMLAWPGAVPMASPRCEDATNVETNLLTQSVRQCHTFGPYPRAPAPNNSAHHYRRNASGGLNIVTHNWCHYVACGSHVNFPLIVSSLSTGTADLSKERPELTGLQLLWIGSGSLCFTSLLVLKLAQNPKDHRKQK